MGEVCFYLKSILLAHEKKPKKNHNLFLDEQDSVCKLSFLSELLYC